MTFGTDVGTVRRTRYYAGESGNAGLPDPKGQVGPAKDAPVTVSVTATYDGTAYLLTVESAGQRTTVPDVAPDELETRISRLIRAVSKAARNGELDKSRQPFQLGLGTPTPNRDRLRFAS